MKFILGKKLGMTQKFKEDGKVTPVTVVAAGPCFITQVKTDGRDGYQAVQVGFEEKKKVNKPLSGHFKNVPKTKYLKEFRAPEKDLGEYKEGQKISVSVFTKGEDVQVSGLTKGRGFQGVVKRHGFSGAPKTHGTKDQLRHPGSSGATGPNRVFKGRRMGGRMGYNRITVKNLEIVDLDEKNNFLFIKGAIPGSRNSLIEITAPGEMKLQEIIAKENQQGKKTETESIESPLKQETENLSKDQAT